MGLALYHHDFLKISIILLREGITLSVYTVSSVRTLFLKGLVWFFLLF